MGVYDQWERCHSQIDGYPNADYRKFKTRKAAEEWLSRRREPSPPPTASQPAPKAPASAPAATSGSNTIYAVRRGRCPGLYRTWADCKKQTSGFSGCEFRKFKLSNEAEARAWINETKQKRNNKKQKRAQVSEDSVDTKKRRKEDKDEVDTYLLMFDGGVRGNPGGLCGCGAIIYALPSKKVIWSGYSFLKHLSTNNEAEYSGLILGLHAALKRQLKNLLVQGDSELVINQVTGKYEVRAQGLRHLHAIVKRTLPSFQCEFKHVFREANTDADRLANLALDRKASSEKEGGMCK